MILKFWGIRGSIPVPGEKTIKFGGNTPCVQIITKNDIIILDAGTGIRELGKNLIQTGTNKKNISILLTHNHWDHIQGIPFFLPLFRKEYTIDIYSNPNNGLNALSVVDALMNPNFFPVDKEIFNADIKYHTILPEQTIKIGQTSVETKKVNHSKGTLAFKISENDKTIVYMTDNEIKYEEKDNHINSTTLSTLNEDIIEFCNNSDYLIHDSMYSFKDFKSKKGWGHSNNISVAYLSLLAGIKNLFLFHFDPDYSDEEVNNMLEETNRIFTVNDSKINCYASKEGLEIEI